MTKDQPRRRWHSADFVPVPVLDLSSTVRFRRRRRRAQGFDAVDVVQAAADAAGWGGVALPEAYVLGVSVHPVVEFTGAHERLAAGVLPQHCPTTLGIWETLPCESPPVPLHMLGFVSLSSRWDRAMSDVAAVSGLGAGMVLRLKSPSPLQLLDADASDVWVTEKTNDETVSLRVVGRRGPVATAYRVAGTRLMEEGLFAHALSCGIMS